MGWAGGLGSAKLGLGRDQQVASGPVVSGLLEEHAQMMPGQGGVFRIGAARRALEHRPPGSQGLGALAGQASQHVPTGNVVRLDFQPLQGRGFGSLVILEGQTGSGDQAVQAGEAHVVAEHALDSLDRPFVILLGVKTLSLLNGPQDLAGRLVDRAGLGGRRGRGISGNLLEGHRRLLRVDTRRQGRRLELARIRPGRLRDLARAAHATGGQGEANAQTQGQGAANEASSGLQRLVDSGHAAYGSTLLSG